MKRVKFVKTNIIGAIVDDEVETWKELKDKATWLDGCIYSNGMLIHVKEKKAIYRVKEVN